MKVRVDERTVLYAPPLTVERLGDAVVVFDSEGPNWLVTDERGLDLLKRFGGGGTCGDVVRQYAVQARLDLAKAWLHAETFLRDALRQRMLRVDEVGVQPYPGRASYLRLERLEEVWVQVNDFCNLACAHCLVASGPDRAQGLDTARLVDLLDQAAALGVRRVVFTGGEPLARPDIVTLAERVLATHGCDLVVMTNGTLFAGERWQRLCAFAPARRGSQPALRLQVSLDGASPETNDPVRGPGTFHRIVQGLRRAVAAGFAPTMACTVLRQNLADLPQVVQLAASLGVRTVHFLWPHRRGRLLDGPFAEVPSPGEILAALRQARAAAAAAGVSIDNLEEFRLRLDGTPGVKFDLAGAGWTSLAVGPDGWVYPSASLVGIPELRCGDLREAPLARIWRDSAVLAELREATVERKPICRTCALKFLCGGGDFEHAYWASAGATDGPLLTARTVEPAARRNRFLGHDPYCDLYKGLAADLFADFAREGRAGVQTRSGFDRPVVLRGMGERTLHDEEVAVRTTASACVLSEAVIERSRQAVREFYGKAAQHPQADLCCPVRPDADDLAHIPRDVIERFYGCGSPVGAAQLRPGETMVDLGSGAGIDCFVAAKKVGPGGRVYGVDMTDEMLAVARQYQPVVAARLGWDVVEFRKGYLEAVPLPDEVADVVTSNCVINLSPDKPRVLREIWRVLKVHGRLVIADIVADRPVPSRVRADGVLWSQCIGGALPEEAFLAALERAGFYGLSILKKRFWKEVEGCRFYSVTVRGYKFEKTAGCRYLGQHAVYLGPFKAVMDEEGHLFPRGIPVEVCTDTAAKLARAPYGGAFLLLEQPDGEANATSESPSCCGPGETCC